MPEPSRSAPAPKKGSKKAISKAQKKDGKKRKRGRKESYSIYVYKSGPNEGKGMGVSSRLAEDAGGRGRFLRSRAHPAWHATSFLWTDDLQKHDYLLLNICSLPETMTPLNTSNSQNGSRKRLLGISYKQKTSQEKSRQCPFQS
uniref:Histone H2B n=1 Tax=Equus asinus TaxID=9793 RepID=A0A9L0K8M7_EQUAS